MVGVLGLDSSGSECRAVVGSVEHENQPSDSTKVGNFLDQLTGLSATQEGLHGNSS
jgi:hypothetical protein